MFCKADSPLQTSEAYDHPLVINHCNSLSAGNYECTLSAAPGARQETDNYKLYHIIHVHITNISTVIIKRLPEKRKTAFRLAANNKQWIISFIHISKTLARVVLYTYYV